MTTEADSFPRRHARTQRFTLGAPRSFTVAPDGSRVVILRSGSGTDRATTLWVMDTDAPAGTAPAGSEGAGERVAAEPRALLGRDSERLSAEERPPGRVPRAGVVNGGGCGLVGDGQRRPGRQGLRRGRGRRGARGGRPARPPRRRLGAAVGRGAGRAGTQP